MGRKVATGTPDDEPSPRRLVFTKEDIELVGKVLRTFLKNAKARCVILVDKEGHLITKEGRSPSSVDMDTLSSLVAGSYAAVKQMAKLMGEKEFSIQFHQGRTDHLQLSLVGERTILAVGFTDKTTLGMVRLYASQVASKLGEHFEEMLDRGRRGPDRFDGPGPPLAPV